MRVDRVSLTSADEGRLPLVAIVQWEKRRLPTLRSFRCATRFLMNGINRIMKSVIIKIAGMCARNADCVEEDAGNYRQTWRE